MDLSKNNKQLHKKKSSLKCFYLCNKPFETGLYFGLGPSFFRLQILSWDLIPLTCFLPSPAFLFENYLLRVDFVLLILYLSHVSPSFFFVSLKAPRVRSPGYQQHESQTGKSGICNFGCAVWYIMVSLGQTLVI